VCCHWDITIELCRDQVYLARRSVDGPEAIRNLKIVLTRICGFPRKGF